MAVLWSREIEGGSEQVDVRELGPPPLGAATAQVPDVVEVAGVDVAGQAHRLVHRRESELALAGGEVGQDAASRAITDHRAHLELRQFGRPHLQGFHRGLQLG